MNFFLRYFEKKVAFSLFLYAKTGENSTNGTAKSTQRQQTDAYWGTFEYICKKGKKEAGRSRNAVKHKEEQQTNRQLQKDAATD